jgi:flavin-dependent dehydrogenase
VGVSVQCAEYIPAMLKGQLDLRADYVAQKVSGMRTYVSGQVVKETVAPGYIIRREQFDQGLIAAAVNAGAELRCATRASSLSVSGEVLLTPKSGAAFNVRPQVIIGADGPHSTVGKWVGAVNHHLLPGVQLTLPLAEPLIHTEVYFEPEIIAGYGWLFPKGRVANVGLGMRQPPDGCRSIRQVLDRFVSRLAADGKICGAAIRSAAGWIPVEPMCSAVYGNVMLVGDAAGQTHPVTGAGIFAAVTCGKVAGQFAAQAVSAGDIGILKNYDEEWQDHFGNTLALAWQRRELMESNWSDFPDIVKRCWVAFREYYAGNIDATA